jgi:hypothetical protein
MMLRRQPMLTSHECGSRNGPLAASERHKEFHRIVSAGRVAQATLRMVRRACTKRLSLEPFILALERWRKWPRPPSNDRPVVSLVFYVFRNRK